MAMSIVILAMTMLGWAGANYRGWTVMLLGVIPLPPPRRQGYRVGEGRRRSPYKSGLDAARRVIRDYFVISVSI
jgi:hypothetical protein